MFVLATLTTFSGFYSAAGGHFIVASSPALLHCLTACGQTIEKGAKTKHFSLGKINVSAPFSIDFAISKINGEGSGMRRSRYKADAPQRFGWTALPTLSPHGVWVGNANSLHRPNDILAHTVFAKPLPKPTPTLPYRCPCPHGFHLIVGPHHRIPIRNQDFIHVIGRRKRTFSVFDDIFVSNMRVCCEVCRAPFVLFLMF